MSHRRHALGGGCQVLYVSDPSTIARTLLPDPVREEDLRRWVDMLADSGVDVFDQEVFSQGWTVYWQSDTYEYDQRPQHRRFLPMLETGVQPLDVLVDQAHRRGMGFVAGFRINDGHAGHNRKQGVGIARFIESHPHLRLRDPRPGPGYQEPESLDFTHSEVRDFTLGVVREVAERFPVDGVELCFRDAAYFPPDQAPGRAHLMTDMVRNVRGMLDERSSQVGRRLTLGARVFATTKECARQGLDAPEWIRDGILDYVSPQDTMYADYHLPYSEWSSLTKDTDCLLYPGLNPWISYRARYRLGRIPLSHANARALAHTMYRAGADGLAIYNHFVPSVWQSPFYPQAMLAFHQLRDPDRVARGERHYVFNPTYAGLSAFGEDGRCSTGVQKAQQLRLDRGLPSPGGQFHFQLFEDLNEAFGATLLFRGFGMTEYDEMEVHLNGGLIPDHAIGRTASSGRMTTVDSARKSGERSVPCIVEGGRIDFRRNPEEPWTSLSTRWFSLEPAMVRDGDNCLSVTLLSSDPDADSPAITIDEMEVFVEPR